MESFKDISQGLSQGSKKEALEAVAGTQPQELAVAPTGEVKLEQLGVSSAMCDYLGCPGLHPSNSWSKVSSCSHSKRTTNYFGLALILTELYHEPDALLCAETQNSAFCSSLGLVPLPSSMFFILVFRHP